MIIHTILKKRFSPIRILLTAGLLFYGTTSIFGQESVYVTGNAQIHFESDAPLELISAESDALQGAVDIGNKTFAFTISNSSFKGFNSALQQEHFYENYIETQKYPRSTFQGKIIEDIDPLSSETQEIRAKGILDIHGMKQERIIRSTVLLSGDTMFLQSSFTVPLKDHNIKIPRIVDQKIAEIIEVTVTGTLIGK